MLTSFGIPFFNSLTSFGIPFAKRAYFDSQVICFLLYLCEEKLNMHPIETATERTELIQSYIMTTSRYDFSVYEKRVLYRIIQMFQEVMSGKEVSKKYDMNELVLSTKNNVSYNITKTLFGDAIIKMPLNLFCIDSHDKNHRRIKNAFKSLMKKIVEYENGEEWEAFALIETPKISRNERDSRQLDVSFRLNVEICKALFDFSKGFRSYELEVAWKFNSVYTMRFYELFSKQQNSITYSIDRLRSMFGLENKYSRTNDFVKNVVEKSKKELDSISPYSFNYITLPKNRGRTTPITSIMFVPYRQDKFVSKELLNREEGKQVSINWYLNKQEKEYLINKYEFTNKELQTHAALIKAAKDKLESGELLDVLGGMKIVDDKGKKIENRKGYVINTLKKIVAEKR